MIFSVPQNIYFEIVSILFLFPLIVGASSFVEPGNLFQSAFDTIGIASYAVYTLHKPLYQLLLGFMKFTLPFPPEQLAPWIGIVYVPCLLGLCLGVDRLYDSPLRKGLSKLTIGVKPERTPAPMQNAPKPIP